MSAATRSDRQSGYAVTPDKLRPPPETRAAPASAAPVCRCARADSSQRRYSKNSRERECSCGGSSSPLLDVRKSRGLWPPKITSPAERPIHLFRRDKPDAPLQIDFLT